jgi:hypothetical protein
MQNIVRCTDATMPVPASTSDLRLAASGTAFSTNDPHAHVRHRHPLRRDGPAAGPGGGREAPQIRGIEGLFSIWGLSSHCSIGKNAAGYPHVVRATDARRLAKRGAPDAPRRMVRRCLWRGTILDHRPKPPIVRQSLFSDLPRSVRWCARTGQVGRSSAGAARPWRPRRACGSDARHCAPMQPCPRRHRPSIGRERHGIQHGVAESKVAESKGERLETWVAESEKRDT